jgi:hypothetical protein
MLAAMRGSTHLGEKFTKPKVASPSVSECAAVNDVMINAA